MSDLPNYRRATQSADPRVPMILDAAELRRTADAATPNGFRQHAARPVKRLAPIDRRAREDQLIDPGYDIYDQNQPHYAQPGTQVTVNNGGQFYRPWKEELALSGFKTVGNFFAWPFRLIGRLVEHLFMMGLSFVKIMLVMVITPVLLISTYSYYQAHKNQPATEMAADLGKSGIGIIGSALHGVWDGLFGDDKPKDQPNSKS